MTVRAIDEADHLAFIATQPSASFLQTPAWGRVKAEWRRESLGFFDGPDLVGTALVLYRQLPKLKRFLAYVPEGPVLDWSSEWAGSQLAQALVPLARHCKAAGAFGVRIGPPVVTARWSAQQVKDGIADESVARLTDLAPDERGPAGARVVAQLRELGWQQQLTEGGFSAGQPQYNFWVRLAGDDGAPLDEDAVLKTMNQQWRRNIKKAAKAGVEVSGTTGADEALAVLEEFHGLYVHTAERDHFTPRPLGYFRTMVEAMAAEAPDRIRLYTARHEGDLVAATIAVRVGRHAWYSYGASSTEKRDVRGSNAVQWQMMRDALAAGATVYDLRGITDTLDADDPHVGLIQFKVGTGGEAVEYAGEWDLPLNRALYKAFSLYMARR
ncbi:peptidoglycan bridge formation glycyltransferase FemA/FemB family protein [Nocardioides sp. CBS4Y-1]|uniref:Peptidoglycan bridge formation glycyltransferase FemA/FemB family protein n=1 Tax=Nocardioides acrostichi TaxID=2784339 RepID=A0A930V4N3_9ACTN|nr:peptidoglycan bridge formation glycyltransferase FemA/FemB family protein [Nocardioides acrostichi]